MHYIFLSQKFYADYPQNLFPEIMRKDIRPYIMVQLKINGYDIGLPLRSNIEHKHAFWTDQATKKGIDYSKTIVITDKNYIDKRKVYLDDPTHKYIRRKEYEIKKGFQKYLRDYKKALKKIDVPRNRKLVNYSTLQYFHTQLMIELPKVSAKNKLISLYSKEFPSIKYISENAAKAIKKLNEDCNVPLTVKEIRQRHTELGKRLEKDGYSKEDLQEFNNLQDIVDDLKNAQLKDKQKQAHQETIEQTTNKLPSIDN